MRAPALHNRIVALTHYRLPWVMEEGLEHVCFRDVAWLQSFPLTDESVLDYFAMSPFYDRTCNNEVLRMQARYVGQPKELLSQLQRMQGVEYGIWRAMPPTLWVIVKRRRVSPEKTDILAAYYLLNGSIYLAPNLHTLLTNRVTASMDHLRRAVEYAESHLSFDALTSQYRVKSGGPVTQDHSGDNHGDQGESAIIRDVLHTELGINVHT